MRTDWLPGIDGGAGRESCPFFAVDQARYPHTTRLERGHSPKTVQPCGWLFAGLFQNKAFLFHAKKRGRVIIAASDTCVCQKYRGNRIATEPQPMIPAHDCSGLRVFAG